MLLKGAKHVPYFGLDFLSLEAETYVGDTHTNGEILYGHFHGRSAIGRLALTGCQTPADGRPA